MSSVPYQAEQDFREMESKVLLVLVCSLRVRGLVRGKVNKGEFT